MLLLGRRDGVRSTDPLELGKEMASTPSLTWGDSYVRSGMAGSISKRSQSKLPGRLPCGNRECSGSRALPWRSRRRPIFEGQWGCSARCVEAMVRAAVRREYFERSNPTEGVPHRHRVPLGLVLLAQGWITQPQLQSALDAQRAQGGRIGDWLVAQCGIERQQITRGLSAQWGCPVLTTSGFEPKEMALVMPKVFVNEFGAVPVRTAGGRLLYLGFEDRLDATLALALEHMTGLRVESGLLSSEEFQSARRSLFAADYVAENLERVPDTSFMASRIAVLLEQKQPVNARLVRLHQYFWLRLWLENGAMSETGVLPRNPEDMLDHIFLIRSIA